MKDHNKTVRNLANSDLLYYYNKGYDITYYIYNKGNVSWNIPDFPSLGGEKIQIVIRFGMPGEDSDIFLSEEFTICTDISNASIKNITDKTYTGDPIKQSLVVETTSRTFKEGTNYTVSYKNNVKQQNQLFELLYDTSSSLIPYFSPIDSISKKGFIALEFDL